ncbi:possible nucleoside diphosphate sugar epimerase (plasmid) [Rhodococcus jostii RHA1]|jgi:NADH dehydrogenase|uniref:Possible nucleoside diphosphate sugar epimerase n=2 Tax=Rhodococcus TaxID=1827 RepID=Q0RZ58_RHOJR|nr:MULTISPECIES: SDR family oxidoreductase [Rhodococcus]ABG99428.1 possible nucleoside diphosphate sugar epimerase [Rhodococcus jostii RHA1]EID78319.1 nucleoside diphosphate sugar epimerase [Rhodococcus opacus RKJ300 = JCM 13270]QQZ19121.1 SDR family oxidoreductase [Rhodococcus sp. 21391]
MIILVAGGTGRLGSLVVHRLAARGHQVRVLTRDPASAAATGLAAERVQTVTGDVRDATSLQPAADGVDLVISAVHGLTGPGRVTPASVDRDGIINLVDAARAAGAEFVLVSAIGTTANHPIGLFRMKAVAEHYLHTSGVPWTIVRSTAFAELYLDLLAQSTGRSGRPVIFGRGDNPINFVATDDVAALIELAALDASTRGQLFEIGGPRNLTFVELTKILGNRIGDNAVRARHVPRLVLRALAATGHLCPTAPARLAELALYMDTADMTFDSSPLHDRYPQLPATNVADAISP